MKKLTKEDFYAPFQASSFLESLVHNAFTASNFSALQTKDRAAAQLHDSNQAAGKVLTNLTDKMADLRTVSEAIAGDIGRLSSDAYRTQSSVKSQLSAALTRIQSCSQELESLLQRMSKITVDVVDIKQQMESYSLPANRATEAIEVLQYFHVFTSDYDELVRSLLSHGQNLPELIRHTNIMHSVLSVTEDLHNNQDFEQAKQVITSTYNKLVDQVLDQFTSAYHIGDVEVMRQCANCLTCSKDFNKCYDLLICLCTDELAHNVVVNETSHKEYVDFGFFDQLHACFAMSFNIIEKIFLSGQRLVLNTLIQKLFDFHIKNYVEKVLSHKLQQIKQSSGNELNKISDYLETLKILYKKTCEFEKYITEKQFFKKKKTVFFSNENHTETNNNNNNNNDDDVTKKRLAEEEYKKESATVHVSTLELLHKSIFSQYQKSYMNDEMTYIKDLYQNIICASDEYNPDQITYSPEDTHRTFSNSSSNIRTISQDVAITMIQENKAAIERCVTLTTTTERVKYIYDLFSVLLDYLLRVYCSQHLEQIMKPFSSLLPIKSEPNPAFFKFLDQINAIFYFVEKHFDEYVSEHLSSTSYYSQCMNYIKKYKGQFETRLEEGLDKCLNVYLNMFKNLLNTHQKSADFLSNEISINSSACCKVVCGQLALLLREMSHNLDQHNVKGIVVELGCRFVRLLLDHIQNYSITCTGAMNLMCDVKEYQKCFKPVKTAVVDKMFETLCALVDFLIVSPGHLKELLSNTDLVCVDRQLIQNFVQLRRDFKESAIGRII